MLFQLPKYTSIVDEARQTMNHFFYNIKSEPKLLKTNVVVFSVYILLFEPSACILNILRLKPTFKCCHALTSLLFVLFLLSFFSSKILSISSIDKMAKRFGTRAVSSFLFSSNDCTPSFSPMSSQNECSKSVSHSQLCLTFSFSIFEK